LTRIAGNILLAVIIGLFVGAVAYVVSSRQEKKYQSTTSLFFNKGAPTALLLLGPEFGQPDVDEQIALSTAAIDLNSFDVAVRTAKDFPILKMNAGQVAANVEATPIRETLIINVSALTPNGFLSATLAEDYVKSYLNVRRDRDAAQARGVKRALQARLARLPALDRQGPPGQSLRDRIATYDTLIRVGTAGPVIVQHAQPSSVAASPRAGRDGLFGGLFGLAVGAGLVALRSGGRNRSDVDAARQMSARPASHGPPPP
jgi:uncharacterized protein involved in exopolysaccharide biosynthesis